MAARIQAAVAAAQAARPRARPLGVGAPLLAFVLACLGTEWALRKRWGLP